jgi:YggT family protein
MVGLIDLIFRLFELLILARVLLSWVQLDPYNPIVQFIHQTTEPVLRPIRNVMPRGMMFDFSPMIALILAMVLESIVLQIFRGF